MHPLTVEQEFMERSARLRAWGTGLLAVAALLWAYAAWQMFVPYTDHHWAKSCGTAAFADRKDLYVDNHLDSAEAQDEQDHLARCASLRDWPGPVSALVVSTPLGVAGGVLYALGGTAIRMRSYEQLRAAADAEAQARSAKPAKPAKSAKSAKPTT